LLADNIRQTDRQTDKETNRRRVKHNFLVVGKYCEKDFVELQLVALWFSFNVCTMCLNGKRAD